MLLIPDLLAFELTGVCVAEVTNASTTGLVLANLHALTGPQHSGTQVASGGAAAPPAGRVASTDAVTAAWNDALIARLGFPRRIFPPLVGPGRTIGRLTAAARERLGFDAPVVAVGSHDTASAVVAAPLVEKGSAFLSCGTWGLIGVELDRPIISAESREANFTNERGVDGRTRFLRNVMGLWLLNESMNAWAARGRILRLPELLDEASAVTGAVPVFDVDDPRFLAPGSRATDPGGDMPARIAGWLREHGERVPESPAALTRTIIESLAIAFATAARQASELTDEPIRVIHVVGGGAQNTLLCRRTAALAGVPVVAGPVEATALGNVLVQARALGAFGRIPGSDRGKTASLEDLRRLVARVSRLRRYEPADDRVGQRRPL
jgi:rhamnulokinase